jgi:drug/metabolite transporter (DMT)-like permease
VQKGVELMAILLAMATAVGWGAADYFGGDASSSETPVFVIVAITELIGLVPVVAILLARGSPPPDDPRLLLAALSGVAVAVELGLIYRALARGNAFITAPIGALGSAAAVTVGLIGGDPLDLAIGIGLACALLGGAISTWTPPTTRTTSRGATWHIAAICLGAAAAVAVMLTSLHAAARVDPYWATAIEHSSTALAATTAVLITSRGNLRQHLPPARQLPILAVIAAVGTGGDLAYTAASHHGGNLSVVSAISSMYPIATIMLARILHRHRATRTQLIGISFALAGAALLGTATS